MIFRVGIALGAMCTAWALSSPVIFFTSMAALVVIITYEQYRLRKDSSETAFAESVLKKRGIEALVWELDSYRELQKNSLLPGELKNVVNEVAKSGHTALRSFPGALLHRIRGSYLKIIVERADEGISQFGTTADLVPLEIVKSILLDSKNKNVNLTEDGFAKQLPLGRKISTLYILSDSFSSNGVYFLVGYEKGKSIVPFERELLQESLRSLMQALREYSEIQEVSAKAEKEKAKQERYVAHISHDIRTPLNNIQAILDLFFLEGLNEENEKFLQVARTNCRSLRDIVEDLLQYTKYREGKLAARKEVVSPSALINEVLQEFELTAKDKNLELLSEGGSTLGINVDRKHIKRILLNLVSNGLKYTESGSVKVSLRESGDDLEIVVTDSGIGIPRDRLKDLFLPFSRLGELDVEGVGLGLALTKILVEANGGTIRCESIHGEGSTFTISFPKIAVKNTPLREQITHKKNSKQERVLIFDDCPDAGRTLAKLLSHHGFEVMSTTKLADIGGIINFWKPTVIISDVHTSDGGIEGVLGITEELDMPIIVVTGSSDEKTLQKLKELNLSKIVQKPVEPEELIGMLQGAC